MPKVLVSMNPDLLAAVDGAAARKSLSRSAYLQQVLLEKHPRAQSESEIRRLRRAMDRARKLGAKYGTPGDSTSFIRKERDRRAAKILGPETDDEA